MEVQKEKYHLRCHCFKPVNGTCYLIRNYNIWAMWENSKGLAPTNKFCVCSSTATISSSILAHQQWQILHVGDPNENVYSFVNVYSFKPMEYGAIPLTATKSYYGNHYNFSYEPATTSPTQLFYITDNPTNTSECNFYLMDKQRMIGLANQPNAISGWQVESGALSALTANKILYSNWNVVPYKNCSNYTYSVPQQSMCFQYDAMKLFQIIHVESQGGFQAIINTVNVTLVPAVTSKGNAPDKVYTVEVWNFQRVPNKSNAYYIFNYYSKYALSSTANWTSFRQVLPTCLGIHEIFTIYDGKNGSCYLSQTNEVGQKYFLSPQLTTASATLLPLTDGSSQFWQVSDSGATTALPTQESCQTSTASSISSKVFSTTTNHISHNTSSSNSKIISYKTTNITTIDPVSTTTKNSFESTKILRTTINTSTSSNIVASFQVQLQQTTSTLSKEITSQSSVQQQNSNNITQNALSTTTPAWKEQIFSDQLEKMLEILNNNDFVSRQSIVGEALPYAIHTLDPSVRERLGYQKKEMFLACRFNDQPCSIDKDLFQWNNLAMGNCYTFNHRSYKIQKIVQKIGMSYGLTIFLKVSQDDYLASSIMAGVRVYIKDFETALFPDAEGFSVSAGFNADFLLEYSKLNRIKKPYGNCVTEAKNFYYNGKYSFEGCTRSCYQNIVLNKCGCGDPRFAMPKSNANISNVGICGLEKVTCVRNVNRQFGNELSKCQCAPPCEEHIFSPLLSVARRMVRNPAETEHNMTLNVYFRSFAYVTFTESPSYSILDAFSDFGSVATTFLTSSFLTIFELIVMVGILIKKLFPC